MPFTLTRSLLVIILPGLIALCPWAVWFASTNAGAEQLYKSYAVLANATLIGLAILIGSVIESAVSHLEVRWDHEREEQFEVRENWFAYLSCQPSKELVGFRYVSRLATTMYFELAMIVAAPVSLFGFAITYYDNFVAWPRVTGITGVILAIGLGVFFYKSAKESHRVLCEARKEIMARSTSSPHLNVEVRMVDESCEGLRVSEVVALRCDHIDLRQELMHVSTLKNGVPSTHPICFRELHALRQLQRSGAASVSGAWAKFH